ncbi:hypothetical protein [Solidesulfovibrio alcoholivorans]|uniref:hypothetical protein n=1 Tax=Solidesulfovibrio alcoholivorans TaxID=81406 RepID=UPI0012EC29DE|nr:hypothetical protein [Solidesulfovibrio alcoholivorans]
MYAFFHGVLHVHGCPEAVAPGLWVSVSRESRWKWLHQDESIAVIMVPLRLLCRFAVTTGLLQGPDRCVFPLKSLGIQRAMPRNGCVATLVADKSVECVGTIVQLCTVKKRNTHVSVVFQRRHSLKKLVCNISGL